MRMGLSRIRRAAVAKVGAIGGRGSPEAKTNSKLTTSDFEQGLKQEKQQAGGARIGAD